MASVTVTVAIRYALMGVILSTAYFTVQGHSQTTRTVLTKEKTEEISQYVTQKIYHGLSAAHDQNTEVQTRLHLPYIEGGYIVELGCIEDRVAIEISGRMPDEDTIETLYLDCDRVNATGKTTAGAGCLTFTQQEREEEPNKINVNMTTDCEA